MSWECGDPVRANHESALSVTTCKVDLCAVLNVAGMDGTDINSCCRSPDCSCFPSARCTCSSVLGAKPGGALLASADDSGAIHLLNYPAVVGDAPAIPFRGHASHVCTVQFTADGRRLVSTGGSDRSSFQWRVIRPHKSPPYMEAALSTKTEDEVSLHADEQSSPRDHEMDVDDIAHLRVELLEAREEVDKQSDVAQHARDALVEAETQLVAAKAARDDAMHKLNEGGFDENASGHVEEISKLRAELEDARKELERRRTDAEATKVELAAAQSENAKLVLDLARRTAAVEAGDAMVGKLRDALRKGRTERATAEKEITRLHAQISRLNAEITQHVNTQHERHELRLKAAESERRESVTAYKLQMREGEMDKLRAELAAVHELVLAEKAGGEKQLEATRAANGQVSAAEAAVSAAGVHNSACVPADAQQLLRVVWVVASVRLLCWKASGLSVMNACQTCRWLHWVNSAQSWRPTAEL